MASKSKAQQLGEQGFLGASNIGPSSPEAQGGHVGPLDPVGMLRRPADPLGITPGNFESSPPKAAGENRRKR